MLCGLVACGATLSVRSFCTFCGVQPALVVWGEVSITPVSRSCHVKIQRQLVYYLALSLALSLAKLAAEVSITPHSRSCDMQGILIENLRRAGREWSDADGGLV